jgi:hypothetical protein
MFRCRELDAAVGLQLNRATLGSRWFWASSYFRKTIEQTNWCPGWESNPHEEKSPEDFKSSASAIPPPGRRQYKSNEYRHLLQHHRLTTRLIEGRGASSGVSGAFCGGVQPLHGGQCVLRGKVSVSHRHADGLVTEKLLHLEAFLRRDHASPVLGSAESEARP